jgi:hypothetical protein
MALRPPALVAAALLAAACAGASGGTDWQGSVTDSAGIQIVRNPDQGTWGPDDAWELTEVLRVGTAEGEPEYQFGALLAAGSMDVASDGRIVVLDAQGQHLKVFTPGGTYERTIGGPGGGPGEIGIATQATMLIAPGDTIVMVDLGNQRVNLYLLDGTFARSFPVDLAAGFPFRWERAADGRVVVQFRKLDFAGSGAGADTTDVIAVQHLDGTVGDTLMRVPSGKTIQFSGGLPEWNFFVPEPMWALWGERILHAVNDSYRIGVHGPGARLERVIEKPFTLLPVTDADKEPFKRALRKAILDQGAPPQIATQLVDTRLHFAPNYPAFTQMLAGPFGTIMVQQIDPLANLSEEERENFDFTSAGGSPRWDVFDDQGRYLGVMMMPEDFQPIRFRGNEIYGVQRDELDVQYVVKLRVTAKG